jgi:Uncharacterized conserved protein (DUF2190)
MADYTPVNADATAVTLTAGTAVTGGLLVGVTGTNDQVVHTSATTNRAIGVAAHDAPAGGRVTIYLLPGFIHELPVSAGVAIAANGPVVCSTTPGRIESTSGGVWATASGAGLNLGICVRGTTGTVDGTAKARFLGL